MKIAWILMLVLGAFFAHAEDCSSLKGDYAVGAQALNIRMDDFTIQLVDEENQVSLFRLGDVEIPGESKTNTSCVDGKILVSEVSEFELDLQSSDLDLIGTPEQRAQLHEMIRKARHAGQVIPVRETETLSLSLSDSGLSYVGGSRFEIGDSLVLTSEESRDYLRQPSH